MSCFLWSKGCRIGRPGAGNMGKGWPCVVRVHHPKAANQQLPARGAWYTSIDVLYHVINHSSVKLFFSVNVISNELHPELYTRRSCSELLILAALWSYIGWRNFCSICCATLIDSGFAWGSVVINQINSCINLISPDSFLFYFMWWWKAWTQTQVLNDGVYTLIAVGGFFVILGFLGCCGASRENRCFLLLVIISSRSRANNDTSFMNTVDYRYIKIWRKVKIMTE